MTSLALRSRHCLIEDIKCLETQLSSLQDRFDVIVHWIRSQYSGEFNIIIRTDCVVKFVLINHTFLIQQRTYWPAGVHYNCSAWCIEGERWIYKVMSNSKSKRKNVNVKLIWFVWTILKGHISTGENRTCKGGGIFTIRQFGRTVSSQC